MSVIIKEQQLALSTAESHAPIRSKKKSAWVYIWRQRYLYVMLLPAIVYYVLFQYLPLYGATVAFKDFNIMKGILGSPWVGLKHFEYLFALDKFWEVIGNTIIISFLRLLVGFPFPLIVALLLNEVRLAVFKKSVQTIIYLPHFISWVILGGLMYNVLSLDDGVINNMIKSLGGDAIGFMTDEKYFRFTMVFSMVWKEFGWNSIIFIAALAGVNPQLYEAATIDGANRWQKIGSITIPCIRNTIAILLILRLGTIMEAGFEQIFVLYHPGVYSVADIIDTYVYRTGLAEGRFSLAAAIGLFKSLINFILLVIANKITRMMGEEGVY
jgi:putative aldouronate transport system permease protein